MNDKAVGVEDPDFYTGLWVATGASFRFHRFTVEPLEGVPAEAEATAAGGE